MKFYVCEKCGNFVGMIKESGVPMMCCGQKMTEVVANTTDGAREKHVPVVKIEGYKVTVTVGSVEHPMTAAHSIQWIALQTKQGNQRKVLDVNGKPEADFMLCEGDEVIAAFEYCNLHGLWKATK